MHGCRAARTQVRLIEKAREAIWEEAATAGQRVARGMIARKGSRLMQAHSKAARNVRRALDSKEVVVAHAALTVLRTAWDESRLSKRACPWGLVWKQRELAELTAEVGQLMGALSIESEAHASLAKIIESVEEGSVDFAALEGAWQSAGEAAPLALSVELASAMRTAKELLEAEEVRVREAAEEARCATEATAKAAAKAEVAEVERAAADAGADGVVQVAVRLVDKEARAEVKRQGEEYGVAEAKRRRDIELEEMAQQGTACALAVESAAEADSLAAEGMDVIEVEVRNGRGGLGWRGTRRPKGPLLPYSCLLCTLLALHLACLPREKTEILRAYLPPLRRHWLVDQPHEHCGGSGQGIARGKRWVDPRGRHYHSSEWHLRQGHAGSLSNGRHNHFICDHTAEREGPSDS